MLQSLTFIHFLCFFSALLLCGILEYTFPYKKNKNILTQRRIHNIFFAVINGAVLRLGLVIPPVAVGIWAERNNFGLANIANIPFFLELIVGLILFDLIIYFQHRLFHKIPFLWKIHSVHHSDSFLDTTTALRFHLLEVIPSLLLKGGVVVLLGLSMYSIVFFEIALIVCAIFNHSNIDLTQSFDKKLSHIFVTPRFHQVHHSIAAKQTHSNFGTIFSFWDKIFTTYTSHFLFIKNIGLEKNQKEVSFLKLLIMKFK